MGKRGRGGPRHYSYFSAVGRAALLAMESRGHGGPRHYGKTARL
jgi:hypothetical protein